MDINIPSQQIRAKQKRELINEGGAISSEYGRYFRPWWGVVVSALEHLLGAWARHFSELGCSKVDTTPGLQALQNEMEVLASKSFQNEEMLLDVPFSSEDVSAAV